jgi:hypothetical protein
VAADSKHQAPRVTAGTACASDTARGTSAAGSTTPADAHHPSADATRASDGTGATLTANTPVADHAGIATKASGLSGHSAVPAVTAVAEQPAASTTVGVLCRPVHAIADHKRSERRVDEAVDVLTEWACDPVLKSGVKWGVDELLEQSGRVGSGGALRHNA